MAGLLTAVPEGMTSLPSRIVSGSIVC